MLIYADTSGLFDFFMVVKLSQGGDYGRFTLGLLLRSKSYPQEAICGSFISQKSLFLLNKGRRLLTALVESSMSSA